MSHLHADAKLPAAQAIVPIPPKALANLMAISPQGVRRLNLMATVPIATNLMAINHPAVPLPALTAKKHHANHHLNHTQAARKAVALQNHTVKGLTVADPNVAHLINLTVQEARVHQTGLMATGLIREDHLQINLLTAGRPKLINQQKTAPNADLMVNRN